jgi:chromosome segregation ATPase
MNSREREAVSSLRRDAEQNKEIESLKAKLSELEQAHSLLNSQSSARASALEVERARLREDCAQLEAKAAEYRSKLALSEAQNLQIKSEIGGHESRARDAESRARAEVGGELDRLRGECKALAIKVAAAAEEREEANRAKERWARERNQAAEDAEVQRTTERDAWNRL